MSSIWKKGFIYRAHEFFVNWNDYRKVKKNIKDVFYSKEFKELVKQYLNIELEKDWIGRLYGVINPNIDINGNFDVNNVIIEIDGNNTNTDEYTKIWLYRQLNVMGQLYNMKNFYANISYDIRHVGPITQDNYLIVLEPVGLSDMITSLKKLLKTITTYLCIGGITVGMLFYYHII